MTIMGTVAKDFVTPEVDGAYSPAQLCKILVNLFF